MKRRPQAMANDWQSLMNHILGHLSRNMTYCRLATRICDTHTCCRALSQTVWTIELYRGRIRTPVFRIWGRHCNRLYYHRGLNKNGINYFIANSISKFLHTVRDIKFIDIKKYFSEYVEQLIYRNLDNVNLKIVPWSIYMKLTNDD